MSFFKRGLSVVASIYMLSEPSRVAVYDWPGSLSLCSSMLCVGPVAAKILGCRCFCVIFFEASEDVWPNSVVFFLEASEDVWPRFCGGLYERGTSVLSSWGVFSE